MCQRVGGGSRGGRGGGGGGRGGEGRKQRGTTRAGATTATIPLLSLNLSAAAALSNSEPVIPFTFGGKEAVETAVDTLSSRLL